MAKSPTSGKTEDELFNTAVELGATPEDLKSITDNSTTVNDLVGEIQAPTHVAKHVPYGDDLFADLEGNAPAAELEEVGVTARRVKPNTEFLKELEVKAKRVKPNNDLLQEVDVQGERVKPSNAALQEVEAQGTRVTPNNDLLQEVDVQGTRVQPMPMTAEEADAIADDEAATFGGPPVTEHGKALAISHRAIPPRNEGTYNPTQADPSWWTSVGWSIQDYGITGNLGRWMQQALDTPDEAGQAKIQMHLPELTYGVSEEYHDYIAGQVNFEAAEREADRLRTQEYRNLLRQNEGVGQALTAGFVGFVADPINLVPGGAMVKGMTMSAKLYTAAGMRGAALTTVGKRASVWGAAGFGEELVRNAPRLASDPTYKMEGYLTDAALGLAFGGGIPVVGAGARAVGQKIPQFFTEMGTTAQAYGVDAAMRNVAYTANKVADQVAGADGGLVEKFRAVDVSKAAKDAKIKTAQVIKNQVRELKDGDLTTPIKEAIEKLDTTGLQEGTAAWAKKVAKTIHEHTAQAWRGINPKITELGEAIQKANRLHDDSPIESLPFNPTPLAEEIGKMGSVWGKKQVAQHGVHRNDLGKALVAKDLSKNPNIGAIEARLDAIGLGGLTRLGGGVQRVVFSVPDRNDIVIRIGKKAASEEYYDHPLVIKPLYREVFGDLAVEILPRVKANLSPSELRKLRNMAKDENMIWQDDHTFNAGVLPNGQPVIIDGPVNKRTRTPSEGTNAGKTSDFKNFDELVGEGAVPKQAAFDGKAFDDAGAARRRTTAADKIGDAEADVRQVARDLRRELEQTVQKAQKQLDEANVNDDVRKNLQFVIDRMRNQNDEAIDLALSKKGYRPTRKNLNNKDHTTVTGEALAGARKAASQAFDRIGNTIKDELPKGWTMKSRGNFAMSKAMKAGGVIRQKGENFSQAWERTMKGKSHVQRKMHISQITDAFNNQVDNLKYELDAADYLDAKQVTLIGQELDKAVQQVNQQLDLANMLARNPFEDAVVTKAQWSQVSDAWRAEGNMPELSKQFVESKTQSAVKHQFGRLTESLSTRLMKSEAPLAQWFTHNVLETPAGYGGKMERNPLTAAIYAENLDAQARRPVLNAWEDMVRETADAEGWPMLKRIFNKQGNAKTHSDITRLSKEVQLEMNARHFGTHSNASPAVKKFAAVLDAEYQKLHDLQNGHVAGIHDGNKIQGYQHQVWDDQKIVGLLGNDVGRKGLTDLFRQGYLQAGLPIDKATILAQAMVDQKVAAAARPRGTEFNFGEEQLKGMMPELTDVVDRMRKNGTSEDIILEIVDHINKAGKGDTPGYAKSRVPIDLNAQATINGQTISVVDLMDNDVPAIFTRYSKESTARRAISESTGGVLDSDRAMHDMMVNMALEAQELGANVDTRAVRNALAIMMGRQYDGQLPMDVRRARDAVSLAGMGGLGESQLAEFGLAVNRGMAGLVGSMQKFRVAGANVNKKWRGIELTPEQATDKKFLSELQEVSGLYGDMHLIDRRNVHFDAQEKNTRGLSNIVDTATGGKHRPLLQHMQTRFTGYGAIRQFEDQIAMASLVHDLAKKFTGRQAFSSDGRLKDLGVDISPDGWLGKKFKDTVTYKDDGTVENLNLNQWSDMDRNKLGVILNRYASQQVQKGFVGESSPEMMNPWVSFLMQFKSYPMLAAEKQQARHLKFADKEAAMGVALNAASSGAARAIRYHSMAAALPEEKREAYLNKKFGNDFAHDTLMYMGGVGMMVNNYDIASDLAGGRSVASQIPILNYMDSYIKAAGGPLDGNLDDRDMRNIQVAAPLGTIAQSNILMGIIRGMMDNE